MAIFQKITPGMAILNKGWITITYDEVVRRMQAEGGTLAEMTADATKKMWEIVEPGVLAMRRRREVEPEYHPKNYPAPKESVSVRDAFIWSACVSISSTVGLLLANSRVEDLRLLSCKTSYASQPDKMEGHTALLIGKSKGYPCGAVLQVDCNRQPHWCALEPGALEYFEQIDKSELSDNISRSPILVISDDTKVISYEPVPENREPDILI